MKMSLSFKGIRCSQFLRRIHFSSQNHLYRTKECRLAEVMTRLLYSYSCNKMLWKLMLYFLMFFNFYLIDIIEGSRGAGVSVPFQMLWVRFLREQMKYLIFSFLRTGVEAKRGVKFRHSTHNASRIRCKIRSGSILMGT